MAKSKTQRAFLLVQTELKAQAVELKLQRGLLGEILEAVKANAEAPQKTHVTLQLHSERLGRCETAVEELLKTGTLG